MSVNKNQIKNQFNFWFLDFNLQVFFVTLRFISLQSTVYSQQSVEL